MNAAPAVIDLDDADGLLGADRDGLLRAASMTGAHVRAVAAAVDEGALDNLRDSGDRPRTIIWVAGRGTGETAGAMLAATAGVSAPAPIVIAAEAPPWIGPLDVLIVAGDDPDDPVLVGAAASGVRRGARVVVATPYEGPLREVTAGRAAVLEPRLPVAPEFGLCRFLAAGLASWKVSTPGCGWIWPPWPTNWTPKHCATARVVNYSPIRLRRWSNESRDVGWCLPATVPRHSRWRGTRRAYCFALRTRSRPPVAWPTL